MMDKPILSVRALNLSIRTDAGLAQILDHVELELGRGEILGVAGESGCGKSTLIRAILGLLPPQTNIDAGDIRFKGENLLDLPRRQMERRIRGRAIGFIPQDPYLALNPLFKIGVQLLEILRWHGMADEPAAARHNRARQTRHRRRLLDLFRAVQLPDPENALERYPHEFSGGQRQRLLIAASLACQPEVILADEPTTALDVTTQLQILKLLKDLTDEFALSMLFVTHDFGVIAQLCDRVSVMYAGQTIEAGQTSAIIDSPRHPYTRSLLACHPDRSDDLAGIPGQVPSPIDPPPGCRFGTRCPHVEARCREARPPMLHDSAANHDVACIFADGRPPS